MNRKQLVFPLKPWRGFAVALWAMAAIQAGLVAAHADTAVAAAPIATAPLSFDAQREQDAAITPARVSLTLRFKTGQRAFRVGEPIVLELVFRTGEPEAYQLDSDLAGFSGTARVLDAYRFDGPALAPSYWRDLDGVDRYSGSNPQKVPKDADTVLPIYLNDWKRLDKPGKYRVYVTSARFWKTPRALSAVDRGKNEVRTTSNLIEFEVTEAGSVWTETEVQAAVRELGRPGAVLTAWQRDAVRRLGFLDSASAMAALVPLYTGERDSREENAIAHALRTSRRADVIVPLLERQMARPDWAVPPGFWWMLVHLTDAQPDAQAAPVPSAADAAQSTQRWRARREKTQAVALRCLEKLATALESKQGPARARTLFTFLDDLYGPFRSWSAIQDTLPPLPPRAARWKEKGWTELLALWQHLPANDQYKLMSDYWAPVSRTVNPGLVLAALRKTYVESVGVANGVYDFSPRALALKHIYELAPEEGRRLILAEIRSQQPRVGWNVLSLLADRPIPELDDIFVSYLQKNTQAETGRFLTDSLIQRYGSPAILPRMKEAYGHRDGVFSQALSVPALAYLLRTEPPLGIAAIRRALTTARPNDRILSSVAELSTTPQLEELLISSLNNDDLAQATDAAKGLAKFNTPSARAALYRRLEVWNARWAGIKTWPKSPPGTNYGPEELLEDGILNALAFSPYWVPGKAELTRLKALCLTDTGRSRAEGCLQAWNGPLRIRYFPAHFAGVVGGVAYFVPTPESWQVAQYYVGTEQLRPKLAQFPRGTTFVLSGKFADAKQEKKLFREIRDFLKGHGMTLQRETPAVAAAGSNL